ncbi:MAG: hypothetical protein HPY57_13885 [Ignavibacteria bacterium]|nr:hypothetical protein [Ignavibacteria bacterium]
MATKNRFFEFIELKYDDLTSQINNWLKNLYGRSAINLNSASPYGQIINVVKELFQHNILYLKNSVKILDIETTQNKKIAQQTARISGYNICRSISASGTLKFKLKPGIDIATSIKDSVVIIQNGLVIKNKTNSLKYVVNLNVEKNIFPITNAMNYFFIPIIQGVYETQRFTGTGRKNQSFSVNVPSNRQVENFNYKISINGTPLNIKDSIWDMLPNEYACVVKSGFNGGIDIYFGTGQYGIVPANGASIEVKYLLSDGVDGEILNPISNDWKIEGDITDGQGNILNISNLFDIFVETDINFASNGESLAFIKTAIPYVSRNFVLATPNQFIFHLKRLNMFSKVNAFNKLEDNNFSVNEAMIESSIKKINQDINQNKSRSQILADLANFNNLYAQYKNNMNDNEIYLYLIPDIKKYFNNEINYFNIPFDAFYLDSDEQNKILQYLRQLGTMSITTDIKIIQPVISRYVMHVYIRRFDYANEDNIRQEIIAKTSDYFLSNERFDRIPKSDFIKLFKEIDGVDSVSIYFVCKKNEDYHRKASDLGYVKPAPQSKYQIGQISQTFERAKIKDKVQPILQQSFKVVNGIAKSNSAYNQDISLGIDNVHGDIICDKNEYAIIRGGWRDRKGIWYNEGTDSDSLNSINVIFNGVTQK